MKDGDLRSIFRNKFRDFHWTSVETAGSATGVPDSEYCIPFGVQGWIEFKQTAIYHVQISPFQTAWLMKRCRYGGNAWIAVRRIPIAKKHEGVDELWLMFGNQAEALHYGGLEATRSMVWIGGPSNWNYDQIAQILNLKLTF